MLKEDNSGFIHFPLPDKMMNKIENGKTFVYLIAFDSEDLSNRAYELSNLRLVKPCDVVSDDISFFKHKPKSNMSVDELIKANTKEQEVESIYFPNVSDEDELKSLMSVPLTTCICVGWSDYTYELREDMGFWVATFHDLTNEGRKLYYSIKKLHNNKEIRLLTFNNF
jgi:hypothetical protein